MFEPTEQRCFWCGEPAQQVAHYDYFSGYFCEDDSHQLNFQYDMAMRIPLDVNLGPVRKAIEKRLAKDKHKHTLMLMSAAHSQPFADDTWTSAATNSVPQVVLTRLEIDAAKKVVKDGAILLDTKILIKNGRTARYMRTDIEFATNQQLPLSDVINEEDSRGVEIFIPATKTRLSLAVRDGGVYAYIGTYLNDRDSGDTIWLWAHSTDKKSPDVVLTFKRRKQCDYSVTDKAWTCNYFMAMIQSQNTLCQADCAQRCGNNAQCLSACTGTQVNFTLSNSGMGNPLAIRFGRFSNDNPQLPQRMFVANQDGRLQYSDQSDLKNGPMTTMIDFSSRISTTVNRFAGYVEAGFVGMTLHPRFTTNGRFYVWYSIPRPDGNNASNTPNCSFTGGYGAAGPSNNRRNFGVDRPYVANVYADMLVLEEYQQLLSTAVAPLFLRRMLTLKHFFTNHYGINNLMFEENGKLLVALADGGCFFDQYATAQNRSFMVGKVVSVDVDANVLYAPPVNCSTPVALWGELQSACPVAYKIFTLYASGVRNFGHMSLDVHEGKINRYITMVGQNRAEAIYRFQWESNFGWYRRESRLCGCLYDDPLTDPQCDFRQTLAQCLNETSITGAYTYPLATLNQANDHVSSNAGGFVYRGSELPCALRGAYIWGDWSTKDVFTPGFPAPFNGTLQLFMLTPDDNGHNNDNVRQENSHGRVTVGGGLQRTVNYLGTWGYDAETNRMYMGVQDIIPPYVANVTSTRGQIYVLTAPLPYRAPAPGECAEIENTVNSLQNLYWLLLALTLIGLLLLVALLILASRRRGFWRR